ncbi:hypothetical protein GDO81_011927 [Engystomops pustulosus]|uniref:Uncharacterized protein n=1 Tax=Engystomops pustulosus TaxID=76066 RepID=A0AAV7BHP9_ENGPU|nr:hypothetical protein GDO81_011927 [Engystomops pustulosus]
MAPFTIIGPISASSILVHALLHLLSQKHFSCSIISHLSLLRSSLFFFYPRHLTCPYKFEKQFLWRSQVFLWKSKWYVSHQI